MNMNRWSSLFLVILVSTLTVRQILGEECSSENEQQPSFTSDELQDVGTCKMVNGYQCLEFVEVQNTCPCNCRPYMMGINPSNRMPNGMLDAMNNPGGGGGGGGGVGCFHGDDTVTSEHGPLRMSDLASHPDIRVLTKDTSGQLSFSPVRYWMHLEPERPAEFYRLVTDSGRRLSLTGTHLMPKVDCSNPDSKQTSLTQASRLVVGDCLEYNDAGQLRRTRLLDIQQVTLTGIYNPMTREGTIVVNDLVASCYVVLEHEKLQQMLFSHIVDVHQFLSGYVSEYILRPIFGSQENGVIQVPRIWQCFHQLRSYLVH